MPLPVDFTLYLITDRHQVAAGHTLLSAVETALQGGVGAVQLREKDLSIDELRPIARDLRELTKNYSARLLLNHHVELAMEVDADGVHLGGHSLPTPEVRLTVGTNMLIGVSAHSKDEIRTAYEQGADFVTFSPVYATPSKAAYGAPQGLNALAEACRTGPLPVFALGGVTPGRASEVRSAGAYGIALISAIIASPCPKTAARSFLA